MGNFFKRDHHVKDTIKGKIKKRGKSVAHSLGSSWGIFLVF